MYTADQASFARPSVIRTGGVSSRALPMIACACDVLCLGVAGVVANLLYRYCTTGDIGFAEGSPAIGLAGATILCLLAKNRGLYRIQRVLNSGPHVWRLAQVYAVSVLLLTGMLFLLKIGAEFSRGAVVVFAVLGFLLLLASRRLLGAALRSGVDRGVIRGQAVVTIGDAREMERLSGADLLQFGIDEVARVALSEPGRGEALTEVDRVGVARAIEIARRSEATEFALVMPWSRDRARSQVLELLRISPLPVRFYPDRKVRDLFGCANEQSLDPYFSILVQRAPLSAGERLAKRALDVGLAGSLLLLLSPFLLAMAVAIKLDSPGPAIFRQRRGGFDGRQFVIFKFRTMTALEDGGSIAQARQSDPRVTKIGRMLRRTSIDELPQLLNVLRGDMSLVGPRPHALAHDEEYGDRIRAYALRRHVKPGLTGAAQVAGLRGETARLDDMERRIDRDLWYINNWSLCLDLKILLQTVIALLRYGAY
jgi:undecaprenyl-phosphate galactose phosphotransferase/putative colanic acid biosynthesis UDP-glucose lipid carrier transferase